MLFAVYAYINDFANKNPEKISETSPNSHILVIRVLLVGDSGPFGWYLPGGPMWVRSSNLFLGADGVSGLASPQASSAS